MFYFFMPGTRPEDLTELRTMDNAVSVSDLVLRLGSEDDAGRKMAAFKLQNNIGDPSFADVFIYEGGLPKLRHLTMNATGNTLAYSLTAFSRLLEVDKGWECVDQDLVKKVPNLNAVIRTFHCLQCSSLSSSSSRTRSSTYSEEQCPSSLPSCHILRAPTPALLSQTSLAFAPCGRRYLPFHNSSKCSSVGSLLPITLCVRTLSS